MTGVNSSMIFAAIGIRKSQLGWRLIASYELNLEPREPI